MAKIGAEFITHVSLVPSERVLHEGQNNLFSDDIISALRNRLREVCMSVDTCWELNSKGVTLVLDKLGFKADKRFDGSMGFVEFFLTAILRLTARNMGDKWFESEGTLF